ncbi:MAG: MarR family transcriptional regulator [Candidatus Dormibacteria bacterium]
MKAKVRALLGGGIGLDDGAIALALNVAHQQANQVCRALAREGIIIRTADGPGGKIVNRLASTDPPPSLAPVSVKVGVTRTLLSEDDLKRFLEQHLVAAGWTVKVLWGHERGIDVVATRGEEHLIVECKGLGELVQRITVPDAQYALALPDNRRFRGLVSRLPQLARHRLRLGIFFVDAEGKIEYEGPPSQAEG